MKKYMDKIDPKQLRLLLLVVILLILFVGYQFGYVNFNNKTAKVEEENNTLSSRYDRLLQMVEKETQYDQEMATYQSEIEEIKSKYGPGNTPEKSIRFLIDMADYAQAQVPTVSFSTDENVFSSTLIASVDNTGIYVYKNSLSISYLTTYGGFKKMMEFIQMNSERMNVDSVTASYDSQTGNLSGTMVIHQFSITGTEKVYEAPQFNGVKIGTDNIFGTIEIQQ